MNNTEERNNRFDAYAVALEIVRAVKPLLPQIRRQDPQLAKQIRDATSSIPLNVAEGWRRLGKDRAYTCLTPSGRLVTPLCVWPGFVSRPSTECCGRASVLNIRRAAA